MEATVAQHQGEIQRARKPQVWCYRGIPICRRAAGGDFPSEVGRLVGLIDCYEALTIARRCPLEPLKLLMADVAADRFERAMFEQFARSLV